MNTGLAIGGGSGASATSPISGENTITKLLLKDHLGSMTAELTIYGSVDTSGRLVAGSVGIQSVSALVIHGFSPWGLARNRLNGDSRGFTGHEHLAELGLIHMNGRIYDPVIGRFLQADPIIQAPHNAQSHNRYSYVMNNPLSFTDPSGFSWWTKHRRQVIGIVAGILTAGAATWAMGAYALANGATIFASASGALNGLGLATAAAAGGFASGGIMGGNIQSALRGAFMAALTVGLVQGISDVFSHITGGTPDLGGISQGVQDYMAGGNSVVGAVNSTPGLPSQLQIPVSDANGGLGEFYPTGSPSSAACGVGCGELRRAGQLVVTGAADRGLANAFVDWWQRGIAGSHTGISQGIFMGIAAAAGPLRGLRATNAAARGASTMETSAIRFTQSSVSSTFKDGRTLQGTIDALKSHRGNEVAQSIPPIRIFDDSGTLRTLDNRRLLAFSEAGREVPYVWASPAEVLEAGAKGRFSATAQQLDGWFIRVKGVTQ